MSSVPDNYSADQDAQLLAQIQTDLSAATRLLSELPSGVTVFGSARTPPDDAVYKCAERLGTWLGRAGVPVLTGGGPGIMEAVNRGARGGWHFGGPQYRAAL